MLIILMYGRTAVRPYSCTDALMQRPYPLPYSPTQQNVEKFLRNAITGVGEKRYDILSG
ncbi:MAG: hypothetical protein F6K39_31165 [Okeania sp. SIO3B3]|nr:hypothetical protein [Okeania sp. SIO3B3]